MLLGVVRASGQCRPIAGAKVELFQTSPAGRYSKNWAYRATTFTDRHGVYRFESPVPGAQSSEGAPHIHVYVSAPGFVTLRTSYNLRSGETQGRFDVVLPPSR